LAIIKQAKERELLEEDYDEEEFINQIAS